MKMPNRYLLGILLYTVLFAAFILLGSLLWIDDYQRLAIITFLLAFMAAMLQLFCIMLFAKHQHSSSKG